MNKFIYDYVLNDNLDLLKRYN